MSARAENVPTSQTSLEVMIEWSGTVMAVAHLPEGGRFTLGEGADFEFSHPAIPAGTHFTVAEVKAGRVRVAVPPGVGGWTRFGDEVAAIEPGERFQVVELEGESRARVEIGDLVVHCGRVPVAAPLDQGGERLFDRETARSLGAAAALHAVVFIMAWALPLDAATLTADVFDRDDRFVEILYTPDKPVDPFEAVKRGERGDEGGEGGAPAADAPPRADAGGAPAPKSDKKVVERTREMARAQARAAAEDAMAALNGQTAELFSDRGPLSERAASAMNAMYGRDDGLAVGLGGVLPDGPGAGPGGRPGTSIAGGDFNTCADCDGPGGRFNRPGGPEYGRPTPKVPPRVIPRDPVVVGGLSKDDIQRVIRRNRSQYQFCYEKDLKAQRDLAGKLTVKFTIGPNGRVIAAGLEEDTVGADVGACVLSKVRRWQFPTPPGGGIVNVRYPFLFRASQ